MHQVSFAPVYVVGGRQREDRSLTDLGDRWYGYDTGVVLRVSPDGVDTAAEYTSRPGTCAEGDPVLFKSASRVGDRLYCCTQTEIVVYRLPGFEVVHHVSLPRFNDVHHVVPVDVESVLVANSGMETVVHVRLDGEVIDEWNVLGEDTWAAHDRSVDYRLGVDLKPHRAHPNHLCRFGDDVWVDRFELKDMVVVGDPDRRIEIGGERIHDGVVVGDEIMLTSVDGKVLRVDPEALQVTERTQLTGRHDILGWCRGLMIDGDEAWVGFSRIRPTKLRQTVSWVRTLGSSQAPTRITRYRISDWTLIDEIDLEPYGLNAVFSVLPAGVERPFSRR